MASLTKIGDNWRALVRRKGHKARCKTFPNKAQAEAWARQVESEIDQGIVRAAPGRLTVAQVIKAYRELREGSRPISDSSNTHYMLKRLVEGLGEKQAGNLSPQDLVDYAKMRREEGAGPYTCNMEVGQLGTVMRYAVIPLKVTLPDVVSQARPLLTHLGLIGGGGKRERRPVEDELVGLLNHLKQPYADAVAFAVATALRRSELCAVRWEHVDEAKKLLLIKNRKDPRKKIGNDQWIPLLPDAWALLQRQPRSSDRIFPIHPQTISKYFKEACKALGIPDLRLHDMRHEGASQLFEDGYSIEQAARAAGIAIKLTRAGLMTKKPAAQLVAKTKESARRAMEQQAAKLKQMGYGAKFISTMLQAMAASVK
jgi:integrase